MRPRGDRDARLGDVNAGGVPASRERFARTFARGQKREGDTDTGTPTGGHRQGDTLESFSVGLNALHLRKGTDALGTGTLAGGMFAWGGQGSSAQKHAQGSVAPCDGRCSEPIPGDIRSV